MRTADLDDDLPPSAVAQHPVEPRDAARLLVDGGTGGPAVHRHVRDLPSLLQAGDLLVVNDTRVLPARVAVVRPGGGAGEVLLLEPVAAPARPDGHDASGGSDGWWTALCRPSRRLPEGSSVRSAHGDLVLELGPATGDGRRLVRPVPPNGAVGDWLLDALAVAGEVPLPPYVTAALDDPDRYQTVFARRPASAAAPTAGLHLTAGLLEACRGVGVGLATVELVVGLDTFRPIDTELVEDHPIHTEWYRVPEATWAAVEATRSDGGRVVAVGTTSVRSLESRAATGLGEGRTSLFIRPGHEFAAVDLLLTNFHLPRSSLLALVEAFVGTRWRRLYAEAVDEGYRFLSFGDASLLRPEVGP